MEDKMHLFDDPWVDESPEPKERKRTPGDDLWDAVCEEFGLEPAPKIKSHQTRLGKLKKELTLLGAIPADIKMRAQELIETWGKGAHTPEALIKHWDQLGSGNVRDKSPGKVVGRHGKYDGMEFK